MAALALGQCNPHTLIRSQQRNSGKALLGLVLQQEGVRTCSVPGVRGKGESGAGLVGQPREWLRWSAYAPGGALCRVVCNTLLLLPAPQLWQLGFGLLVSYCS